MRKDRLIFKVTKHNKSLCRRFAEQDLTDKKSWERFKEIYPNFVKDSDIEQHREALIQTMDLDKFYSMKNGCRLLKMPLYAFI